MSLEVDLGLALGGTRIEATFTAPSGVTALFGRSGAGKTSIVNAIAGLVRPVRGRIRVDGVTLFDAAAGIDVPPHRRRLGYVFQDGRLFPHLSVVRNLLYGHPQRSAREPGGDLAAVVRLLDIGHLLARRPGALSGGEKQRVAIGRALLSEPRLLLMDEPLASLDADRKREILPYLERLHAATRIPILYVSHALDEVVRIADTLVLVGDGKVQAAGPLTEVLGRLDLRDAIGRFEAGSVLTATVEGHDPSTDLVRLRHASGTIHVARLDAPPGSEVRIRVRARDVALATGPVQGLSVRNRLLVRVAEVSPEPGPVVDLALRAGGDVLVARITRAALVDLDLAPGREVTALLKTVAVERRGMRLRREEDV